MTWTKLKQYITDKTATKYTETEKVYFVWLELGREKLYTEIYKDSPFHDEDKIDFETNYKPHCSLSSTGVYDATNPIKVSAPIMITHYDIDAIEVLNSCTDTADTLFKTWNFENSYLKGLTIVVEKKETIIKVIRDETDLLIELNVLDAENLFKLNSMEPLHPMFSLYRNDVGVYITKLSFDNTPFNKIEIKLKNAEVGTRNLKFKYGVIIYNEAL